MLLNAYGGLYREPGELLQGMQEFAGTTGGAIHIAALTETWQHADLDLPDLPGMQRSFAAPRQAGEVTRGGVAGYVADCLPCRVTVWRMRAAAGVLWLRVRGVKGLPGDLMLAICYLPPRGSGSCPGNITEWWAALEDDCTQAEAVGLVLVTGDFNARTATQPDWPHDNATRPRRSQDQVYDARGGQLLELCKNTGLRICNGRVAGDEGGSITSRGTSGQGRAVVDYMLACPRLLPLVQRLSVSQAPLAGLDHCALRIDIALEAHPEEEDPAAAAPPPPPPPPDFIVNPNLLPLVEQALQQGDALACLLEVQQAAEGAATHGQLADAQQRFDALICQCMEGAGMQQRSAVAPQQRSRPWRSVELISLRRRLRLATRRRDWTQVARLNTLIRRKAQVERRQRRQLHGQRLARLLQENPKEFFSRFRPKRPAAAAHLRADQWQQHFQQLLGVQPPNLPVPAQPPVIPPGLQEIQASQQATSLNVPFTTSDVLEAVRKTKIGKAVVGPLNPLVLRHVAPLLAPALASLLNACTRVGCLPPAWALSAITPIPKAGSDTNVCDGYRGIAVGTLPAKLYAAILDRRLSNWAEGAGIRAAGQFGFRRKHSCAQAAFVLRTAIERQRSQGGKLFACFVDFQKAYDTVPRQLLWAKLQRAGLHGWFLQAVQALYADVPMCVKTATGCTAPFQSLLGVKQGCPLSPNLFGLYVDDIERTLLADATAMDLPCMHDGRPVPPLLYADDLVLMATSPEGLQKQLDALQAYADSWGLTVNAGKTKVVAFGRRRSAASLTDAGLAFTCGNALLSIVDEFKYLGIQFHSSQAFCKAAAARAAPGRRVVHATRRRCTELGLLSPALHMRMFNTMALPVLSYGAEIWSPHLVAAGQDCDNSRVQMSFLRQMLGVRQSTPSLVVLAETGHRPLAVHWTLQLARFWNNMLASDEGSLVQRALADSIDLATNAAGPLAQQPWAAQFAAAMGGMNVAVDLQAPRPLRVGEVHENCTDWLLGQFAAAQGTKIRHYFDVVRGGIADDACCPALYLAEPKRALRRALAQLRTGAHWLAEETGRWQRQERQQRLCGHCSTINQQHIETVSHFIFACPRTVALRNQYPQLFQDATASLAQFFAQDSFQLASFARACYRLDH